MGFLITLFLAIIFGALGLTRPRLGLYILVGLIVSFEEMGLGFTTFRGSWVFNAFFVGFYGLRLIEVLTVSLYIPFLFTLKRLPAGDKPFVLERSLAILMIIWCAMLTALEYYYTKKVEVGTWRLMVTGMMQFHLMVRLFQSEEDRKQFLKFMLIMLALRAFIGLAMYAAGFGVHSFRGRVPFFYDSVQIEAFGLGGVILWSFLLNGNSGKKEDRLFSNIVVFVMMIILLAAVVGSIRRTIWATTAFGLLLVLVMSRRTTIMHYFAVLLVGAITVAGVLLAPGLEDFRSHMGKYVQSMNLFSEDQLSGNIENEVHVNNVESYSRLLMENPDMILVGVHGPASQNYRELIASYSEDGSPLGLAHNGPIRSIMSFGAMGLIAYFLIYFAIIRRTFTVHNAKLDGSVLNQAAVACGIVLFLEFSATMLFVPPFYTSSKGLFYTFFGLFMLETAAFSIRAATKAKKLKGRYNLDGTAVQPALAPGGRP